MCVVLSRADQGSLSRPGDTGTPTQAVSGIPPAAPAFAYASVRVAKKYLLPFIRALEGSEDFKAALSGSSRGTNGVPAARLAFWTLAALDALPRPALLDLVSTESGASGARHAISLGLLPLSSHAIFASATPPVRTALSGAELLSLLDRNDDVLGPLSPGDGFADDLIR